MTVRSAIEALLPKVRDEIRQLQVLEAALVTLRSASDTPTPVPADEPAVAPAPRRPVPVTWTNSERRAAALQLLRMRGPLRVADIARELEAAQGHIQEDMSVLLKSGHVVRVEHGTYAAVEVVWSGADRAPLVDAEAGVFARRSA